MRFIFLYLFVDALARSNFENTVTIANQNGFLVIKPRYTPLIPTLIIRAIIALMALALLIIVAISLINHRRFDEEMIAILLLACLSIVSLRTMFRATQNLLKKVIFPATVISYQQQEIVIGKENRIPITQVSAIRITNTAIKKGYVTFRIELLDHITSDNHLLCYMDWKLDNAIAKTTTSLKTILSFLTPRKEKLADYLIQIDWDRLTLTDGESIDIPLNR